MKSLTWSQVEPENRKLIEVALGASVNAYAPYSGFAVGAAIRSKSGKLYTGANIENAAYGLGFCAEVSALAEANSSGDYNVSAVAVTGHKFTHPFVADSIVTPCGRCRQLIFEAAQISGVDVRVFSCNGDLSQILDAHISEMLPEAFGPKNLGVSESWPAMKKALQARVGELMPAAHSALNKSYGGRAPR